MKLSEQDLKQIIVDNQEEIRRLLISKSNITLLNYISKKHGAMTNNVAKDFGITIQSASGRLKSLYNLGYLTRSEVTAQSGGIEFVYYYFE